MTPVLHLAIASLAVCLAGLGFNLAVLVWIVMRTTE